MGVQTLTLNDKTVVISGKFGQLMQNLAASMTENGADVALITDEINFAQRYCQNLMDLREVSERYGRSAAIEMNAKSEDAAKDSFSRAAEIFGSIDIYIDTNLCQMQLPVNSGAAVEDIEKKFDAAYKDSMLMSQTALEFIKGRSKSRLIYLAHEMDIHFMDSQGSKRFQQFKDIVRAMSSEFFSEQLTVNIVALGVTEQYLLSRYPQCKSIREAFALVQEKFSQVRLVEYAELSTILSFISSPLSAAINGQIIPVNHGANRKS